MTPQQIWVNDLIGRFEERAEAVKKSGMPPLEGEMRRQWIKQKEYDYMDFAMLGDATGTLEEGILLIRVDLND